MGLPPVLNLLVSEIPEGVVRDDRLFKKAISDRGLIRDLHTQANYSFDHYDYPTARREASDGQCAFHAPSSLNPFSTLGKCNNPDCRMLNASAVGTLAALYTDFLAIPDDFAQFFAGTGAPNADDRRYIQLNLRIFMMLRPLIEAGVIRFAPPTGSICISCAEKAHPEMSRIVESFWEFFLEEGNIEVHTGPGRPHLEFSTALCDKAIMTKALPVNDAKLLAQYRDTDSDKVQRRHFSKFKDFVCTAFAGDVQNALENAAIAGDRQLTGATTTTIDALTIQAADARVIRPSELQRWRSLRSLELPWVRDLDPNQLLQLRHDAHTALPVFRESISARITSANADAKDSDENLEPIVRDLRLQAEEVRQELTQVPTVGPRFLAGLTAGSTIALAVAAVGTANPVTAGFAVGLLALLPNFHQASSRADREHSKLVSKPGYVLLTAQEILRHAHD